MTPDTERALRRARSDRAFEDAQIELDYRTGISRRCHRNPITPDRWAQLEEILNSGDLQRVADTCRANRDEWYQFVFERNMVEIHMRDVRWARAVALPETAEERADANYEARESARRDFRDRCGPLALREGD